MLRLPPKGRTSRGTAIAAAALLLGSLPVKAAAPYGTRSALEVRAAQSASAREILLDPTHPAWAEPAPESFRARFTTSEGVFTIEVRREWAPLGADRFHNLARHGFFDDQRFFRVIEGFIAQFGVSGDPMVTAAWSGHTLVDDPVVLSNEKGTLGYAMTGPDTRLTQIYINLVDNTRLDAQGFAPFGRVIEGMEVVERIYPGYGDEAVGGVRRGEQDLMLEGGNEYLDANFPEMDRILRVEVLADAAPPHAFDVVETSIREIHAAMRAGEVTARELVDAYLARIEAYDKRGPSLNAIIVVHPRAREIADSLDALFRETGSFVGPLHGIPVIVKDNYDTYDLPTTAGSRSLAESIPPDDATMVRKLREAGALVLVKSNMAEFAFSPVETIGSALPGYTFNPYALNRVPAGSSGGTGAAVAASFGTVGLGTDTGNSIRGPSSHNALVGIRPTIGLTSRDGIVPLYLERDVGGPMARSVTDAAVVLDAVSGSDPADPATAEADTRKPGTYTAFLDPDGLRGKRLGVVRVLSNRRGADEEVIERFEESFEDLRRLGATVVDSIDLPVLDSVRVGLCSNFKTDLEAYLATLGPDAPVKTLAEIVESRRYHSSVARRLEGSVDDEAPDPERCRRVEEQRERFREGLRAVMAEHDLDGLIYPTWANPPRLIGDLSTPAGDNSQNLAPPSGFPAITVPMGWVRDGMLPVGLQILGDAWSEGELIRMGYAYEQGTRHRRPPESTPRLREGG